MTGTSAKTLLSVNESLDQINLPPLYARLGYRVLQEWSVRKAISLIRKEKPQVVVADFYYQPDFRDRVSNLESLLAALQSHPGVKVLVYYDPAHQAALDKVKQRFRIDAALPLPVREHQVEDVLKAWLEA